MAELSEAQKEAIVTLLARFKRPAEVVAIMREEYDCDLGPNGVQQVVGYDPTKPAFRADRDKWEPIYLAAREAYTTDLKQCVVANQTWRLNELHDLYEKAKKAKNMKLAAELLEQIAKECGGVMTNTRELTVNKGSIPATAEDRAALLGSMLAEAMDKVKQAKLAPGSEATQ